MKCYLSWYKLMCVSLICLLALLLTGCEGMMSEVSVLKYARQNFGDCILLDKKTELDDSITYTLKDKEYEFNYTITTYMSNIDIDLTSFGEVPSVTSDFNKNYYSYLVSVISPQLNYNLEDATVQFSDTLNFTQNPETLNGLAKVYSKGKWGSRVAEQVGTLFQQYDTRGYYHNCDIPVYSQDDERLGSYSLATSSWRTPEDEAVDYFSDLALYYDSSAKYIRTEKKPFKETDLSESEIAPQVGKFVDENTIVTFYYFSTKSGEKFIADVNVKPNADFYNNFRDEY